MYVCLPSSSYHSSICSLAHFAGMLYLRQKLCQLICFETLSAELCVVYTVCGVCTTFAHYFFGLCYACCFHLAASTAYRTFVDITQIKKSLPS